MRYLAAIFLLLQLPMCTRYRAVVLTEANANTTVQMRRGQEFGVRLPIDETTGPSWRVVERGAAAVEGEPQLIVGPTSKVQLWRFRAAYRVQKGTLKLQAGEGDKARTFTVTLDVVPPNVALPDIR